MMRSGALFWYAGIYTDRTLYIKNKPFLKVAFSKDQVTRVNAVKTELHGHWSGYDSAEGHRFYAVSRKKKKNQ